MSFGVDCDSGGGGGGIDDGTAANVVMGRNTNVSFCVRLQSIKKTGQVKVCVCVCERE